MAAVLHAPLAPTTRRIGWYHRARGLLGGIELRRDDGTPATTETAKAVLRATSAARWPTTSARTNVIELTPPLVIDADTCALASEPSARRSPTSLRSGA